MISLGLDHADISKYIRSKKKKMLTSQPELIGTSPVPDMNAQDIYDIEQKGRVESTLDSPEKSNADITNLESQETYDGVGLTPEEKTRMGRLRSFMSKLKLDY